MHRPWSNYKLMVEGGIRHGITLLVVLAKRREPHNTFVLISFGIRKSVFVNRYQAMGVSLWFYGPQRISESKELKGFKYEKIDEEASKLARKRAEQELWERHFFQNLRQSVRPLNG